MSLLERISTKLKNVAARGLIHLLSHSGDVRRVQVNWGAGDGDTHDGVPAPDPAGFCAAPPPGLPCVGVLAAGDRSAGVVVLIVDPHRPAHEPMDSVIYDWHGNKVHLSAAGIDLDAPGKRIRLTCQDYELNATRSVLTSVGGYADKLTHVSEGNLVRDLWHDPAVVVDQIHSYPLPQGGTGV